VIIRPAALLEAVELLDNALAAKKQGFAVKLGLSN
jgi:hypothetical protein